MHKRIKALDGMRGLAILMVVCHHFFKLGIGSGGVDVFFILSGYLITSILIAERNEPHFWTIFYSRRATRILPVYVITLTLTAVFIPLEWHSIWY